MKHTFKVTKSNFNFSLHTREFDETTGDPTTSNPTVEFEVVDGQSYADAEDFFGVLDEVTALAENYDLVAMAIEYVNHHDVSDVDRYDAELSDTINTAIDMLDGWIPLEVPEETLSNLQLFSERLNSLK